MSFTVKISNPLRNLMVTTSSTTQTIVQAGRYPGMLVGSPSFVSGQSGFGQCIVLNGSGQYVDLSANPPPALNAPSGSSWTVDFWFKTSTTVNGIIACCTDAAWSAYWYFYFEYNGSLFWQWSGGTLVGSGATGLNNGAWHHVRGCYDGAYAYLFIDGTLSGSRGAPVWSAVGTPYITIGCRRYGTGGGTTDTFFTGDVDEFAGFTTCLSTTNFSPPSSPWSASTGSIGPLHHLDGDAVDASSVSTSVTTPGGTSTTTAYGALLQTPITAFDLNPDVTTMDWTTDNPGGFGTLTLGMQRFMGNDGVEYGALPQSLDIPYFADVEIWYGSFLCYKGRVIGIDRNDSGLVSGFQCNGYGLEGLKDQRVISQEFTPKSSGVIIREVISQHCPLLVLGPNFVDPGVYHVKSDFTALFPADVINTIIREGGAAFSGIVSNAGDTGGDVTSGAWDYLVYEGNMVSFQPRLPTSGPPADPPDYLIPFDNRVTWHESCIPMAGDVMVRYQNTLGNGATALSPTYTSPSFVQNVGFQRQAVIEGGKMRPESAAAFARTYLSSRVNASYAVKITRRQLQGMEVYGGTDRPPWMVRAGQWVGVGDQPYVPIIHTEYDAVSEQLQIECGDMLPHGSTLIRQLNSIAAHFVAGTNPSTGSRTT